MATYLDCVNGVLRRLRETEASTVSDTPYVKLVADFVNEAKREVEDAWDWEALAATYTITTSNGVTSYAITGAGDASRIHRVYNTTNRLYLEERPHEYFISNIDLAPQTLYGIPSSGVHPHRKSIFSPFRRVPMVPLHNKHPQKDPSWRLMAEFVIPEDPKNPHLSVEAQITEILAKAGLEPEQQRRIRLSIQQALMNLDAPSMTLLIRISISGTGIKNPPPLTSAGSLPVQPAGTGVGFFLVRRIVGQFHESSRKSQRMLEVLIYRD